MNMTPTPAQIRVLRHLADGHNSDEVHWRTAVALWNRGWCTRSGQITAEGRLVLDAVEPFEDPMRRDVPLLDR